MCLGIPGRVVGMDAGFGDQLALVEVEGAARKVNIGMLDEPPPPGQWVLIHMGFAVELTDAAGAQAAMSGLELLGRLRARARGRPRGGGRVVRARPSGRAARRGGAAGAGAVTTASPDAVVPRRY